MRHTIDIPKLIEFYEEHGCHRIALLLEYLAPNEGSYWVSLSIPTPGSDPIWIGRSDGITPVEWLHECQKAFLELSQAERLSFDELFDKAVRMVTPKATGIELVSHRGTEVLTPDDIARHQEIARTKRH